MNFIWKFTITCCLISLCHCIPFEELWTREKCIEELGCFYAGSPYFDLIERPISLLPDDRDTIDTKFYLFNFENDIPHYDKMDSSVEDHTFSNMDSSIDDLFTRGFNPKIKTKFIIPGFMSQFGAYWKMPLVEHLLQQEECNVFLVDWHGGDGPIYEQAVSNTRVVGAEIAQFIKNIQKKSGISLQSIHIIGHSLGSHIAGYAGKRLDKLGRITALDPAGPYFTSVDPIVRLDKSDAYFVDAIHTNAAPSRFQGFGLTESVAHVDFWPNGGHLQPGCPNMGSSIWTFLTNPHLNYKGLHDIMCNHMRVIDLYISSIRHPDCQLSGNVCDSWNDYVDGSCAKKYSENPQSVVMGVGVEKFSKYKDDTNSINVYLNTTSAEPFCIK